MCVRRGIRKLGTRSYTYNTGRPRIAMPPPQCPPRVNDVIDPAPTATCRTEPLRPSPTPPPKHNPIIQIPDHNVNTNPSYQQPYVIPYVIDDRTRSRESPWFHILTIYNSFVLLSVKIIQIYRLSTTPRLYR